MLKRLSICLLISSSAMAVEPTYFTSPSGEQEVCEVPTHDIFSKKNTKKLKKLCQMDFYGLTPEKKVYAICPKLNSTNPAVNLYKLNDGTIEEKKQAEKNLCRDNKLEAKFKQSITCSYYPSIIGYYHLTQFLEGPEVPAAVYRTMDKAEHRKITKIGIKNSEGVIKSLWKQFDSWEKVSDPTGKKARLYTEDLSQIAGALSDNPKGEEKYTEVMGRKSKDGKKCSYEERPGCFKEDPASGYPSLSSPQPVNSETYPFSFQDGAKFVQKLKDVSEMLIMDHIMSQGDRFGNQHYYDYYFYQTENNKYKKVKAKHYTHDVAKKFLINKKDPSEIIAYKQVTTIPVMLMKDNDCGIIKRNVIKEYNFVAGLKHLNYGFYKKLIEFQQFFEADEGRQFFKENSHFRDQDYNSVQINLNEVVDILKSKCQNGELKFDLSLKGYFNGAKPEGFSCL